MELMAQSVSWFYPSFPGRHLYVEKCLRIVLDWVSCASQNLFLLRMARAIHMSVLFPVHMWCVDKAARQEVRKYQVAMPYWVTDLKSRIEHELELLWLGFLLSQNGCLRKCLTSQLWKWVIHVDEWSAIGTILKHLLTLGFLCFPEMLLLSIWIDAERAKVNQPM